jgi:hypothetical protein
VKSFRRPSKSAAAPPVLQPRAVREKELVSSV